MNYKGKIELLNRATECYDAGTPIMTDKEWDDLYFEVQKEERQQNFADANSPTQKVHFQLLNKLEKVNHNHPMLSLDKTKDWGLFCDYFRNKDAVIMPKCDGLTVSLKYENGKLISAETRGNGIVGEDILHNALTISNIPKRIEYLSPLIIDGEVVCKKDVFNKQFAAEYANARNFSAGSIRLLNSEECAKRQLSFIAWNIVGDFDNIESFTDRMLELANLGFETVCIWNLREDIIKNGIPQEELDEIPYDIDGLVGRFDNVAYGESLGATSHHARAAYAFKFYDEEYETKLLNIEYEPSRNGELTPVAVFEDVDTGDSIINRASLHNMSIMHEILGEYASVGQKIWVCKKNEIIPQIVRAEPVLKSYPIPIPRKCPVCGEPTTLHMSDSGVKTLYCSNDDCSAKVINQFEHFCGKTGLDIKGLSKKTLEKLIDWGWLNDYEDIFKLRFHRTEWERKDGFGVKSVSNILQAIEDSLDCTLDQFLCAIGIPLIGRTASKVLAKEVYSWDNFMELINSGECDFTTLDGFGVEMNSAIKNFDYSYMGIEPLGYYLSPVYIEEEKSNSDIDLNGITFCITGKLNNYKRDELKTLIQNMGGKVTDAVSKNTNFLITNTPESGSSKNKKAKELGISILTEDEMIKNYLTS